MITSTITLYALPEPIWREKTSLGTTTIDIHSFVKDALAIENRIQKGVNQENERSRLSLCCSQLEAAIKLAPINEAKGPGAFRAALASSKLPVVTLGQSYLSAIKLMYQKAETRSTAMRLGATYFPPNLIESHIDAFINLATELGLYEIVDLKQKIAFFKFAADNNCGVVEIQYPFNYQEQLAELQVAPVIIKKSEILFQSQDEDEGAFDNEGRSAYDILYDQVARAIDNAKVGKPSSVNFSNQPHNIITDVLNEFAYSDSGKYEEPIYIQVIYTDGSQGEDLPLQCLPRHGSEELEKLMVSLPLRAALLSMRHLEMDDKVDFSWFRNREVSKARAFSETDQFCYTETKKQLAGTRKDGKFVLHLYQTGLQPAVIGFYRALIEELIYREKLSPSIAVVPFYYGGKSGYKRGETWS